MPKIPNICLLTQTPNSARARGLILKEIENIN